jgi:hypothetical protein
MKPLRWITIVLVGMTLLFGCGDDDDDSDSGDDDAADDDDSISDDDDDNDDTTSAEYPESCENGPVLPFDLTSTPMVVPFPNNEYLVEDGTSPTGFRVQINSKTAEPITGLSKIGLFSPWLDVYNELTGFSTLADLYLPAGVEPTFASIPDELDPGIDDGVFLFVDDPESPIDGTFAPVKVVWREPHLLVTPWFPLKERTRYVLVATRELTLPGSCYRASESMREIWRAWTEGEKGDYAGTLTTLDSLGLAPENVLSIAAFTTGWITRDMEKAAEVLYELAEDTGASEFYDWDLVPDADPRLWATGTAKIDTPIFQPKGGRWSFDGDGAPIIDHEEAVLAYFTLPDATAHPDGQPYPILIYNHGLFSTKNEVRPPFTTEIAAQGFATVGIDQLCTGDRMPAGMGEIGQFFCYFDIFDPGSWRDTWRESVAGVLWLALSLKNLEGVDLDNNGTPDFDISRIYHLGSSMGSIIGGTFAALAKDVDAHVLASSGAKLTSIALEGEAAFYFELIEALEEQYFPDLPLIDIVQGVMHAVQAVMDPIDSTNFLVHINDDPLPIMNSYAPQVFQQGSAYDDTLGGPSGGWLCRAGGWPQMEPYVWDAGVAHVPAPYSGSAFYQYDTDDHNFLFDTKPLGEAVREQIFHYLRTHLETGTGEIIDPYAKKPVACP